MGSGPDDVKRETSLNIFEHQANSSFYHPNRLLWDEEGGGDRCNINDSRSEVRFFSRPGYSLTKPAHEFQKA